MEFSPSIWVPVPIHFTRMNHRIQKFQQTEVNVLELFLYLQIYRYLLAEIKHWLNFQVNQTRKECNRRKVSRKKIHFMKLILKSDHNYTHFLSLQPTLNNDKIIILFVMMVKRMLIVMTINKDCSIMWGHNHSALSNPSCLIPLQDRSSLKL